MWLDVHEERLYEHEHEYRLQQSDVTSGARPPGRLRSRGRPRMLHGSNGGLHAVSPVSTVLSSSTSERSPALRQSLRGTPTRAATDGSGFIEDLRPASADSTDGKLGRGDLHSSRGNSHVLRLSSCGSCAAVSILDLEQPGVW